MGDVDLLLPLNDDPNVEPISRLSAKVAPPDFQNSDMMMTMPLDLDVSFGAPITASVSPIDRAAFESAETLPAALRRDAPPAADSGFIDFDLNETFKPNDPNDPGKKNG